MSAISGRVDRRRDLTSEATGPAPTTPSPRGGPLERRWTGPCAVLGHSPDPLDTAHAQPATAGEPGRPLAVLVLDGFLDNAGELRSRLDLPFPRPTDADLVLHAYLRWGDAVAEHLSGVFAFAVWDARTRELVLCRDRFGVRPLLWVPLPDGALFASDLATLAAHPLVEPELDAEGLCALLAQVRRPGHGALRGVREVRPGHLLRLGAAGSRERRYWSPEARPHEDDLATTIDTARGLLGEAVARQTGGAGGAVLLSGGLDSSALTGLLAARHGTGTPTFTVSFGDTAATVPDGPFARAVVDHLGCDHHEILVDPAELTDPRTHDAVLDAKDHPSPFGDKNITPYLFYRQVAGVTPTVLSGEAADVVFGGLLSAEEREVTGHRTFPWIERARAFGMTDGFGNGLFDRGLLRRVDLDGFCADRYAEARQEVAHLPGAPEDDRRAREIDHFHMTRLYEQGINHSERLGAAVGLRICFPFSEHRLFSYLYNVPWRMKSFDGRDKSLLRAIARDLLPDAVLDRPKVPFPITYHPGYKQSLTDRLRALLDDRDAPVLPLLDRERSRQVVDDPRRLDRGGWLGRADTEMVLQLDAWLRRRQVRLVL